MHRINFLFILLLFLATSIHAQTQAVQDDFEGNGTIKTWYNDACNININTPNPYPQGINVSSTVLEYEDVGGQYANVGFDLNGNFDLSSDHIFSLKIYVPSNSVTGSQPNQISLKLQNRESGEPWATQSEIIKPIDLDQWQTISFDFLNDAYINLDPSSPAPIQRTDFNRILIQVNGENNNDHVLAYIDDFTYNGVINLDPDFNTLIWADEFNVNGPINSSNWFHQTQLPNGGSWFNGEIQHYTDREENSFVNDGTLRIVGKKETYTNQGHTKQYTSARLNSKYAFQYGKVEVRAKLPMGVGTWPAIWTLGKNINESGAYWQTQGFGTTGWPACGEIDIMEHWGDNQNYVQSATHTPSSFGATVNHGGQNINTASNNFHTYTLKWYPEKLVFAVDGVTHYIYEPTTINADTWPFDAEQYILLNFAFQPHIDPGFSEDALEVDYVRVYQNTLISSTSERDQKVLDLKNVPNPVSDYTIISYSLSEISDVNISIQDVNGRTINTLIDERQMKGTHEVKWDTNNLPSGIYFYTLKTADNIVSKKCILNK